VLQKDNLITNLSEQERSEGFLSVDFTFSQLEKLYQAPGIFVASEENRVVGYLMTETAEFSSQFPVIATMVRRFDRLNFLRTSLKNDRILVYGPVCIDRKYRGIGVLEGLYKVMRESLKEEFDFGVLFISKSNRRSFSAHVKKLGMFVVYEFEHEGKMFWTLMFSLGKTVR